MAKHLTTGLHVAKDGLTEGRYVIVFVVEKLLMNQDPLAQVWFITGKPPKIKYEFADVIFNADETGIFYKLAPYKILRFKGDQSKGGKLAK